MRPGLPGWAVFGDGAHRTNLVSSIHLRESDQEALNLHLFQKYARMAAAEQRAERFRCEDAETIVVACGTPAHGGGRRERAPRGGPGSGSSARRRSGRSGGRALPLLPRARRLVVVEASDGQLEDELRLALSHAGAGAGVPIHHVRRHGGLLPSQREIAEGVRAAERQVAA